MLPWRNPLEGKLIPNTMEPWPLHWPHIITTLNCLQQWKIRATYLSRSASLKLIQPQRKSKEVGGLFCCYWNLNTKNTPQDLFHLLYIHEMLQWFAWRVLQIPLSLQKSNKWVHMNQGVLSSTHPDLLNYFIHFEVNLTSLGVATLFPNPPVVSELCNNHSTLHNVLRPLGLCFWKLQCWHVS